MFGAPEKFKFISLEVRSKTNRNLQIVVDRVKISAFMMWAKLLIYLFRYCFIRLDVKGTIKQLRLYFMDIENAFLFSWSKVSPRSRRPETEKSETLIQNSKNVFYSSYEQKQFSIQLFSFPLFYKIQKKISAEEKTGLFAPKWDQK